MQWIRIAAVALMLVPRLVAADDKPKTDPPPAQRFADLQKQFDVEFQKIVAEFRQAKPDEQAKVRERAFQLPAEYSGQIMAIAEANAKDPVALQALMWVATVPGSRGLPPTPQYAAAVERLVRDHAESPLMADLCPMLEFYPDAERALRQIRDKNPSRSVRALAGMTLADRLAQANDSAPAKAAEAESLLAKSIDEAKGVVGFPESRLRDAEGSLYEMRHLSVGKPAPDAESTDLDGKKVKLSDLKGKVVVLDFWATFCQKCCEMIPHERALVKKLEGKPFVLVSVSADAEKDELVKFLKNNPMPWTHWWSGARGGLLEKWNVKLLPTIYVIDAQGTIRYKNVHDKKLDEAVETLLKEAGK